MWVHWHYSGNEIANELTREGSVHQFVGLQPTLGISKQNIRQRINSLLCDQHIHLWKSLTSTQRQAWELISDPNLTAKIRLLSFNRMQSRVVTGLLTWHKTTLRRNFYLMGLIDSPCVGSVGQKKKPQHTLCKYGALITLKHDYV